MPHALLVLVRCARMGVVCEPRPVRPGRPRKRPHSEEAMLLEALGGNRAFASLSLGSASLGTASLGTASSGTGSAASSGNTSPEPDAHGGHRCREMDEDEEEEKQEEEDEEEEGEEEEDRSWALAGAGGQEGQEGKWWGEGANTPAQLLCNWQAASGPMPTLRTRGQQCTPSQEQEEEEQGEEEEEEAEEGLAQAALDAVAALEAQPLGRDQQTLTFVGKQEEDEEEEDWAAVASGLAGACGLTAPLATQPTPVSLSPPIPSAPAAGVSSTTPGLGVGPLGAMGPLSGMGMGPLSANGFNGIPGFNAATLALWAMHTKQLQVLELSELSCLASIAHHHISTCPSSPSDPAVLFLSLSLSPVREPAGVPRVSQAPIPGPAPSASLPRAVCPPHPAPGLRPPPYPGPRPGPSPPPLRHPCGWHGSACGREPQPWGHEWQRRPQPPTPTTAAARKHPPTPLLLLHPHLSSPLPTPHVFPFTSPPVPPQACHAALARYVHAALLPPGVDASRLPLKGSKGPLPAIDRNKANGVLYV
jgi:hypothetical protein